MFYRKISCVCALGLEYKTSVMEQITSQLDYLTYVCDPLTLYISRILKKRDRACNKRKEVDPEKGEEAHLMALVSDKYKPTLSSSFLPLSNREAVWGHG